jgi:hypothetical protein
VIWPDGKQQVIPNLKGNQLLKVDYANASPARPEPIEEPIRAFTDVTKTVDIDYRHQENPFNDFQYEVLLPHIYSRNGPALATGDVNGDGLDDFYAGGAIGFSGTLILQQADGKFVTIHKGPWESDAASEDLGAAFFDADQDGDLDLYVVSGGNEYLEGASELQDRLYLNQGNAKFTSAKDALPELLTSGSRVKAADYDADGDLDLFVGGRLVPRSYPLPADSYLLRNDGDLNGVVKFTDVTEEVAPDLLEMGMVTDAAWSDYDQDGKLDLVVAGEWMPITFLKNIGGTFVDQTEKFGLSNTTGWWYSVLADDFDADGDTDLVAGNLGLNYKYQATQAETFDVYAYDYDKNGNLDIVLGYYYDGVQYPLRGRQCSSEQIPAIKVKFEDYNSFAVATLEDVYSEGDLEAALHYKAQTFASSYLENQGDGFAVKPLPNPVQLSSINGMVSGDFNQDGKLDLVVAGNMYNAEVETTRNDAGYGALLLGGGEGTFKPVPYSESGIYLPYDTKDLAMVTGNNQVFIVAANNNNVLSVMQLNSGARKKVLAKN